MNKQAVYYQIDRNTYNNIAELSSDLGISMTHVVEGAINNTHKLLECTNKLTNENPLNREELDLIYRLLFTYGKYMNKHLKNSIGKALLTQLELQGTNANDIDKVKNLIG